MYATALSLIGFSGWLVFLTFAVALFRLFVTVSSGKAVNSYLPDGADLPGFGRRLTRARDNCFETLPVFVALVIASMMLNRTADLDMLAPIVTIARLAQSVTHLISTVPAAILVRATFLTVQLGIYAYWAAILTNSVV